MDHFYGFLGMEQAQVRREDLPHQSPRALTPDEQKNFLRAVERNSLVRDRAVALLLFYSGLRVGECSALNLDDVQVSARKGLVIVRSGKRNHYREVPLHVEARQAQQAWLTERRQQAAVDEEAYFLSRRGIRLSPRAIANLLHKMGEDAGLSVSPHVLRHTCLTNLVRAGEDLVLVADIAGHSRLETTRRYSRPSDQDRQAAMDRIHIDY